MSQRLTKIIATLGPSTFEPSQIEMLILSGVNVFRLNFSHGQHDILVKTVSDIRRIAKDLKKPIGILGDLQGPKFRTGELLNHEPIELEDGKQIDFVNSRDPGHNDLITSPNTELFDVLKVGDRILIDDGSIALKVLSRSSAAKLRCEVTQAGVLKEKKGINLPNVYIPVTELTAKDQKDCLFALEQKLDFIALSFVQDASDVYRLRKFIDAAIPPGTNSCERPHIISKIETPQALNDLDAIFQASDGMMVARGDLGVEIEAEKVPLIQKQIIKLSRKHKKPVITATQMLESMVRSPVATRAEVSDVANAVLDGTDAVMLSAETASGQFPEKAVSLMARIITHIEEDDSYKNLHMEDMRGPQGVCLTFPESIARSARLTAENCCAKAIITFSFSGNMARRVSKMSPHVPILALTPNQSAYYRMTLLSGVTPMLIEEQDNTDDMFRQAEKVIQEQGLIETGMPVVFCAGMTHLTSLNNTLQIYQFGEMA